MKKAGSGIGFMFLLGLVLTGQSVPDSFHNQLVRLPQGEWGWLAGDATYSIPLSNGNTVWLFGDSFVGTTAESSVDTDSMTIGRLFVRNALCLQMPDSQYFRMILGQIDTTGNTPAAINAFLRTGDDEPGKETWYWPFHGYEKEDTLRFFLNKYEFDTLQEPGFQFRWAGAFSATYQLPDFELIQVDSVPYSEREDGLGSIKFGSSVLVENDTIFIYGVSSDLDSLKDRKSHLARVVNGNPTTGKWEFFDGTGWSDESENSAALEIVDNESFRFSFEYGVVRCGDTYLLVNQKPISDTIYLFEAQSPHGPWENQTIIHEVNDSFPGYIRLTYDAFVHKVENDSILVSYNLNVNRNILGVPDPFLRPIIRDAEKYRPRFIKYGISDRCQSSSLYEKLDSDIEIHFSPNPFSERIKIEINQLLPSGKLQFFDISGRKLNLEIDLANRNLIETDFPFPKGIYFYRLSSFEKESILKSGKLIKH